MERDPSAVPVIDTALALANDEDSDDDDDDNDGDEDKAEDAHQQQDSNDDKKPSSSVLSAKSSMIQFNFALGEVQDKDEPVFNALLSSSIDNNNINNNNINNGGNANKGEVNQQQGQVSTIDTAKERICLQLLGGDETEASHKRNRSQTGWTSITLPNSTNTNTRTRTQPLIQEVTSTGATTKRRKET